MTTPQRVSEQERRANELIAGMKGNTEQPAPAVAAQPAAAPAAPAVVVQATPNPELEAARTEAVTWQNRYTVLKGKYDAEVPRLTQQLREAQEKINELTQKAQQTPAPLPVTDADRERFGEDMVEMVSRAALAAAQQVVTPLQEKLGTVESHVQTTVKVTQQTATQRFWADVDDMLAKSNLVFDTVNNDPGFIAWLSEIDPASGFTRQQLLDDATKKLDAARTVYFFTTYTASHPNGGAAQPPAEAIQPPAGGGAPDPTKTPAGKIWTRADISKFYDDVRRGVYRGKAAEQRGIEAEIAAAQAQGLVQ